MQTRTAGWDSGDMLKRIPWLPLLVSVAMLALGLATGERGRVAIERDERYVAIHHVSRSDRRRQRADPAACFGIERYLGDEITAEKPGEPRARQVASARASRRALRACRSRCPPSVGD